jgi:hypothetical protein
LLPKVADTRKGIQERRDAKGENIKNAYRRFVVVLLGEFWSGVKDLNLGRVTPTDLQSVAIDRSANSGTTKMLL